MHSAPCSAVVKRVEGRCVRFSACATAHDRQHHCWFVSVADGRRRRMPYHSLSVIVL